MYPSCSASIYLSITKFCNGWFMGLRIGGDGVAANLAMAPARRGLGGLVGKEHSMETVLPAYKPIGERRFRETSGLYWEDFEPGDMFEHRPGRTILDADNVWFTLLTMNTQQVHFDAAYAAKTEWKKLLVDSTFTLAPLTGMSVGRVSAKVFAGDTLYAESTVLSKRESKSRPGQGIVTVVTRGINQDGVEVMSFERTMLVYRRGHSPEEAAGY
jgi:itaconyl-CoA hydratase